jgi:iron complex transport system substrate-binding protein
MSAKIFFLSLFFVLTLHANERIVSLSPSITEIVFALGNGSELVGTSSYSLYPKEAKNLPIIGGYESPDVEKILSLRPTLVVAQSYNKSILKKLKHFGIETLVLRLKSIQNIKDSIIKLANKLHANPDKLIANIDNALKNAPKSKTFHSVMIVYGLHEDLRSGIYIAGDDIFFDDIITACGNTNAYKTNLTAQPVLNYENVIALNPDQIIILHSHATEANVDVRKALDAWYKLPTNASKNGKISIVDESYLHIPSQRVAQTITRLCREMND